MNIKHLYNFSLRIKFDNFNKIFLVLIGFFLIIILRIPVTSAQSVITGDGWTETTVTRSDNFYDGYFYDIDGNTVRGNNLFHSFNQFSVGVDDIARFNGPPNISNIISRVTGGVASNINGTISSTINGANLFFLNRAGVLFGPGADLNLTGSFYVSTGDYLKFDDGSEFSAWGGQVTGDILETASPAAFGFFGNTAPGTIELRGEDIFLNIGFYYPLETLAIVGGDVTLDHSTVWAENVLIASSKSEGVVDFRNDVLDMGTIAQKGIIKFTNGARLDTSETNFRHAMINGEQLVLESGELWGSKINVETYDQDGLGQGIEIDVDTLTLQGDSYLSTKTFGKGDAAPINIMCNNIVIDGEITSAGDFDSSGSGGVITITGKDSLKIKGESGRINASSDGTGSPGDITVTSPQSELIISDALIKSITTNNNPGGTIKLNADIIKIENGTEINSSSYGGNGNGGNITITAGNSVILEDSAIMAETSGDFFSVDKMKSGRAGTININSNNSVQLTRSSILGTALYSTGSGGDIEIRTKNLALNESHLDASTFGEGNAGNIELYVDNLQIENNSGIGSSTLEDTYVLYYPDGSVLFEKEFIGTGNAGDVIIQGRAGEGALSNEISLVDNCKILTTIQSEEGGNNNQIGNIEIAAEEINITGSEISSSSSGLSDAGNVRVNSNQLMITEGTITSETKGVRNAGNVTLDVGIITVDNGTISSRSASEATGNAGTVTIEGQAGPGSYANQVTLNNGSKILTTIENENGGGSTQIGEDELDRLTVGYSDRTMMENALENDIKSTGNIKIAAEELTFIGSEISSSTAGIGAAGEISLLTETLNSNNSKITSFSTGQGAAGSISIGTNDNPIHGLELRNTEISVHAINGPQSGQPREGNIEINADGTALIDDGSIITASVNNGLGGDISIINPQLLIVRNGSKILAQTENGDGGQIKIDADLFVQSADSDINADAGVGTSGDVIIDAPKIDFQSSLAALSTELLDTSAIIKQGCRDRSSRNISSFIESKRSGLPLSPEGLIQTFKMATTESLELPPEITANYEGQENIAALNAMSDGGKAALDGNFRDASEKYARASMFYGMTGDTKEQIDALQNLGQTQIISGEHDKAIKTLRDALTLAQQSGDSGRIAEVLNKIGNAHMILGDEKGAELFLTQSVTRAKDSGRTDIEIVAQNNLGNLFASRSLPEKAIDDKYLKSAELANSRGDILNEAKALANASRAALQAGGYDRAMTIANQAFEKAKSVSNTYEKTNLFIHIGYTFSNLAKLSPKQRNENMLDGYAALVVAANMAKVDHNEILHSYALGNLGDLYRTENRFEEALFLVREALQLVEEAESPELIYRWHWLEGQLLWNLGRTGPAIDAYYRAVSVLEETRQEALSQYGSAEVSFRNAIAPVYFNLIDALLQTSEMLDDEDSAKELWKEARNVMESLKQAELRNYFKDECISELEEKKEAIEDVVDQHRDTAVIYPILLSQHLELLVSTHAGLRRYTLPNLTGDTVRQTVEQLYKTLLMRTGTAYLQPCQDLYDWLVRPYINDLDEHITTLVFVPAGILRTVPVATLHDGRRFLVEDFALAIAPGLTLIDPKPFNRSHATALLAGVSEPMSFPVGDERPTEEFKALDKVEDELSIVSNLFKGETLLNAEFTKDTLEAALMEMTPAILHIASHAEFKANYKESYILAYKEKIFIEEFAKLVELAKFERDPIELLVLSACKSAMGDERAALGLAGIAIKSGARSAVGNLWSVVDEVAYEQVGRFYTNLEENPQDSKAEALRQAQLVHLKSKDYSHPFYWSPFVLINNWL